MATAILSNPAIGSFTAEAFSAHLATQTKAPSWWLERKRAAHATYLALPMPKRTDEAWRFSSYAKLSLESYVTGNKATTAKVADLLTVKTAAKLSFRNGQLSEELPVSAELQQKGVVVIPLSRALSTHSELLKRHFMAQPQKFGPEKFASLHIAFVTEGAFIYIPKGVVIEDPIVISQSAVGAGTSVFPHTLVIAEENSAVTVVELFSSEDEEVQFACGANDLYGGHGSKLTYIAAQAWSKKALSFQFNSTVVRRDARVQSLNVHLGAKQARHESLSQMQAPGGISEMLAVTVARDGQEFDQRTLQIHQAPNTKSDLLYKNALLDQAHTIFSGLIVVDPDAQKTDAYQSNRNLMLSDEAEANALPGLEIQANDVRCTHGATSSRIDPEQEFYLESRGITKALAEELLIFGFFEEVLKRLENDEIHEALRGLVRSRFGKL